MRIQRLYEVFTEYREAEQDGQITKFDLELLIEYTLEFLEIDRERFIENYNNWYRRREDALMRMSSGPGPDEKEEPTETPSV